MTSPKLTPSLNRPPPTNTSRSAETKPVAAQQPALTEKNQKRAGLKSSFTNTRPALQPKAPDVPSTMPTVRAGSIPAQISRLLLGVTEPSSDAPPRTLPRHRPDFTTQGFPKFVQSDKKNWGRQLLGLSSTSTIGASGCGLTSLGMEVSRRLGKEKYVLPDELNDVLVRGGAFSGANLNFVTSNAVIKKEYGVDLQLNGSTQVKITNGTLDADAGKNIAAELDTALAAGRSVILRVDDTANGVDSADHFVLATRKDGDKYMVMDPAYGNEHAYVLKDGKLQAEEAYFTQHHAENEPEPPKMAPVVVGFVPSGVSSKE